MDYTITELAMMFEKHAEEFDKSVIENRIKYEKYWPEDELPDHLIKPFNLSWALGLICREIENIKN